ncbi:MAG: cell division protein FtsZ [Candidatus Methanomethylophilaceae archaeon]|nr:cell division protein FtsZ [Candidatus Methanomethylophilaceae archaeon]
MVTIGTSDGEACVEPRVAVIGVGGAGCNAAGKFYDDLAPVDVIAVNTDRAALEDAHADVRILICKDVTKGMGTRGDAILGKKCARVHAEEIRDALKGHDIAIIIAGMGGGTGSGAAAVVAEIAQGLNMITMAMAIRPLSMEGKGLVAGEGLRALRSVCPSTVAVENDKIVELFPDMTVQQAFDAVNEGIEEYVMKKTNRIADTLAEEIKRVTLSETEVSDGPGGTASAGMTV